MSAAAPERMTKDATSWTSETIAGLDGAVAVPALGLVLPMAEVYARVAVQARPWLVT